MKKIISLLLTIFLGFSLIACSNIEIETVDKLDPNKIDTSLDYKVEDAIQEDGHYNSREEVSLYINKYNKLPNNFITKKEASKLAWESSKGNLWDVTDKMSIGGDRFGNREGKLPIKEGRVYYECDINYQGGPMC